MLEELLVEAMGWLADCHLSHLVKHATEKGIIVAVNTVYDGGWPAFVKADPSMCIAVVWLLMVRRYGLEFANEMNPSY